MRFLEKAALCSVALLAAGCGSGGGSARPPSAESAVVDRLLPGYRDQIVVESIEVEGGRDVFELETVGEKLVIRGSGGVAVASALDHYLDRYGNGHLSWGGDRTGLGARLAPVPGLVRKRAAHENRYIYNFTVHGYTTPYWDWPRWEREIDLVAAKGFNQALVTIGLEKAVIETFTRFGYTAEELRDWIVLPAHQPWQWLGNFQDEGPPISAPLVDERAALGRRITERMRELGITPVVPGFFGLVPPGFAERSGARLDVREQGLWLGTFPRPALLNPADGAPFAAVADAYYEAVRDVFGAVTHFAADPFHEGGSAEGIDVERAAENIQAAMLRAHPDAVWVLQAWLNNPRGDLLAGLDANHALVLDLWGDELPAYTRITAEDGTAFRGVPWVWSIIQNFGGKTGLGGNLEVVAGQYGPEGAFLDDRRGRLTGVGLLMEGIEQNPVVLDIVSELIWREPREGSIALDDWIETYADRRYGRPLDATRRAWRTLIETVYSTTPGPQQGTVESIICARPALDVRRASTFGPGTLHYDPSLLEHALGDLLAAAGELGSVDPYQYDIVDVTRQVLANRARLLLDDVRVAFETADSHRFHESSERFLDLVADQDRLLATRDEFLLGRWIQAARRWGGSRAEQDDLERNARVILTTWSERDTLLREYAHREWAGLVGDLYLRRWREYFDFLAARLAGDDRPPPDFFAVESEWVNQTDPTAKRYTTVADGDALALSKELYSRYVLGE